MSSNVHSLQRRLTEWVAAPAHERNYCRAPRQTIAAAGDDPRQDTAVAIAASLLGTWRLCCGQVAVLGGESIGFEEMRAGTALLRVSLQLRLPRTPALRRARTTTPPLPPLPTARCICLALALADPDAEELMAAFAAMPDSAFADDDALPLFVRELLRLRDGGRPNVTPRLDPWGEILQLWSGDAALLARRMVTLLDHHLQRTRGQPGPAEFDDPTVMLYPAEILALRSVRLLREEIWPKVEHPLMFTNLVTMAMPTASPLDPTVEQLRQRLRSMR